MVRRAGGDLGPLPGGTLARLVPSLLSLCRKRGRLRSLRFLVSHFWRVSSPLDSLDNDLIERDDVFETLGVAGVREEGNTDPSEDPAGHPEPTAAPYSHSNATAEQVGDHRTRDHALKGSRRRGPAMDHIGIDVHEKESEICTRRAAPGADRARDLD